MKIVCLVKGHIPPKEPDARNRGECIECGQPLHGSRLWMGMKWSPWRWTAFDGSKVQ